MAIKEDDHDEVDEQFTVKLKDKNPNKPPQQPQPMKAAQGAPIRAQLSARLEHMVLGGMITKEECLDVLVKNNSDDALRRAVSALEAKHLFNVPDEPEPEPVAESKVIELDEEDIEISPLDREEAIKALNNIVRVKARPNVAVQDGNKFQFMNLPSSYIFYEFDSLYVRPFNIGDLRRMSVAIKSMSQAVLMDVVAGCMTQDPRELTPHDFYFVLYWLRSSSYPKSPMIVKWASRYGVMDEVTVNISNFKEHKLDPTLKEKFHDAKAKGFDYPRMYDIESSDGIDFSMLSGDEDFDGYDWLYSRSQYFEALENETILQRMQRIEQKDVSELEEARDLMLSFKHGVEERFEVRLPASKFNPANAADILEKKAASLMMMDVNTPEMATMIEDFRGEAKEIREKLAKGEDIKARSEFAVAALDIRTFLSGI